MPLFEYDLRPIMRRKIFSAIALLATVFSFFSPSVHALPASTPGNWALNFNGTSTPQEGVTRSAQTVNITKNFTISADIRWAGTGNDYQGVVSRPATETPSVGATGYCLCISGGKPALAMTMSNFSQRAYFGTTNLPVNKWVTVAATYDGQVIRIYMDGVLTDTSPSFGAVADVLSSSNRLVIGREFANTSAAFLRDRAFHGDVDNVEISSGLFPAATTTLVKYTFSEGAGQTTFDSGPSGNTSTFARPSSRPPTWVQGSDRLALTYDSGFGATPFNETYRPYDVVSVRPSTTFSRTGYRFARWKNVSTNANVEADSTFTMPLNPVALLANWTATTQKVTYLPGDGSGATVTAGADTDTQFSLKEFNETNFVKLGFHQTGWQSSEDSNNYGEGASLTMGINDITFTAVWAPDSQRVTYLINGGTGTTPASSTAPTGSTIELPGSSGFERVGYTFAGWVDSFGRHFQSNDSVIVPAQPIVFSADWRANPHRITYVAPGLTNGTAPSGLIALTDSTVSVDTGSAFSREGYTFAGWTDQFGTNIAAGDDYLVGSEDVLLVARWTPNPHAVNYLSSREATGTLPSQADVNTDGQFTIAGEGDLAVAGYHFGGWRLAGSGVVYFPGETIRMRTTDISLVAQWLPDSHTAHFSHFGGETGTGPAAMIVYTDGEYTVPGAGTLIRDGYSFGGWKRSSDNSVYSSGSTFTSGATDETFTAVWNPDARTVTYDAGTGTGAVPTQTDLNTDESFTIAEGSGLSKPGYTFGGWKASSGANFRAGEIFTIRATDLTLTAQWIPNIYNVKYFVGGGATGTTPSATTAATDASFNVATASGFQLAGYELTAWDDGAILTSPGNPYLQGASDTNLESVWTAQSQQVTYDVGDATGTTPIQTDVDTNELFTLASASGFTNSGYFFGGWDLGESNYPPASEFRALPEDMNFSARWVPTLHVLEFVSGGEEDGDIPEAITAATGTSITIPNSTLIRAGYEFGGWTDGTIDFEEGQVVSVTGSTPDYRMVYPIWTPSAHSITYDLDGASGAVPAPAEVVTGETYTVEANIADPEGFTFVAWTDGVNLYRAGDDLIVGTDDTILVAVWSTEYLNVTYLLGNGASGRAPEVEPIEYGSSFVVDQGRRVSLPGKALVGWTDGVSIYEPGSRIRNVREDVTLTAVWGEPTLSMTGADFSSALLIPLAGLLALAMGWRVRLGRRRSP
jgi:uncharacterized repeat protein (TIGR02543 family)